MNCKIFLCAVVVTFGFALQGFAQQQQVPDPKQYFDKHASIVTLQMNNGTEMQVNLIYNDGEKLYYKPQESDYVATTLLAQVSAIVYADGSAESVHGGSTMASTVPATVNTFAANTTALEANQAPLLAKEPGEEVAYTAETDNEPFTPPKKRTITTDSWIGLGDGFTMYMDKYKGISLTWGNRIDFGFSDGWLARNSDVRLGISFAAGSVTYTNSSYDAWTDSYERQETIYNAYGFGVNYGLDFYLHQSEQFKVWTGAEIGLFIYNEKLADEDFEDYWDAVESYGLYVGAQYRFKPNGFGVMVETGLSTYYTISAGLSIPIIQNHK